MAPRPHCKGLNDDRAERAQPFVGSPRHHPNNGLKWAICSVRSVTRSIERLAAGADRPSFVHIMQSSEAPGGIGEGTSCVPAAVTNAIFAATGKRLRQLPVDTAQLKEG